jgi:hypothetical protein
MGSGAWPRSCGGAFGEAKCWLCGVSTTLNLAAATLSTLRFEVEQQRLGTPANDYSEGYAKGQNGNQPLLPSAMDL